MSMDYQSNSLLWKCYLNVVSAVGANENFLYLALLLKISVICYNVVTNQISFGLLSVCKLLVNS